MITYFYTLNNQLLGCLSDIDNIRTFSWAVREDLFYRSDIPKVKDDLDRVYTRERFRRIIETCHKIKAK